MAYQPKSHRKFVATSMAAAMVATAAAPAAMAAEQAETSEATITFSDFGENHRAATEVFKLVEEGIIQGFPDGTFRPDTSITRGAAALMLARGLGLVDADGVALEESDAEGFDDVSSADRVYDATRLLKEEEIIGGYADGTFRSDDTITRAEMAIILANAFDLERTSEEFSFTDRGAASQEAVQALYDNGITQGIGENLFGSDNPIIRSDFSVQLYRAMGFEEDEAPAALNVQSVVSVNSTTMEVTFEGELTEEDLEDMTFMFDPELEVTNVALKDAEVEAADEHMTTTVVLTTAEQEAGVTYQLTGVNGVALETPVTVEAAPLAVMNVAAVTEAYVTTVTADVTGAEDDAEATVEIFAFGDLDEDPAVTETVDVEDGMVETEIENLPLGTHIAVVTVEEESDYTEFTVELPVEKVTSINETEVQVEITEPEVDFLGSTVEVIDNEGNVVEVEETDIASGDDVVFFEFVDTLSDVEGVWTVNGVEFDIDLAAKLQAFVDADTQLQLNSALEDLEIENVVTANLPTYLSEKDDFIDELEEDLSIELIQEFIDEVNADVEESGTEAEQKAAAVEAVFNALANDNDVALRSALQNDNFDRVNDEWVLDYKTPLNAAIDTDNDASDYTVEDIQTEINGVNDAKVDAGLESISSGTYSTPSDIDSVDVEDLEEVKVLIQTYATVDDDGDYVNTDLDEVLDRIELQKAVANVLSATTPNTLQNRLNTLASLDSDLDEALNMDNYIHVNARSYINGFDDEEGNADTGLSELEDNVTVADINQALVDVNTAIDDSLLDAVEAAADAVTDSSDEAQQDALLEALQDLGVDYVAASNKAKYATDASDFETAAQSSKDDVQTQVIVSNLNAIHEADEDSVIEALNVLELDNIDSDNAEQYAAADFETGAGEPINTTSITTDEGLIEAAQDIVDAVNKAVIVAAQVEAINEAEEVAEVKAALDALANVEEAAGYLSIRSVDREFVAAYVLEYRPSGGYGDESDIQAVIGADDTAEFDNSGDGTDDTDAAIKAYFAALQGINDLEFSSTPAEVISALEAMLDEDFNALSNTEKAEIAEAFHDALEFDENDDVTPQFRSLAAVKTAIDAAIAAQ